MSSPGELAGQHSPELGAAPPGVLAQVAAPLPAPLSAGPLCGTAPNQRSAEHEAAPGALFGCSEAVGRFCKERIPSGKHLPSSLVPQSGSDDGACARGGSGSELEGCGATGMLLEPVPRRWRSATSSTQQAAVRGASKRGLKSCEFVTCGT